MKITSIKIQNEDFRVAVSEVFSTNNELKAMICIDMGDKEFDFFQELDGTRCVGDKLNGCEISIYALGEKTLTLDGADWIEGGGDGDNYIIFYVWVESL